MCSESCISHLWILPVSSPNSLTHNYSHNNTLSFTKDFHFSSHFFFVRGCIKFEFIFFTHSQPRLPIQSWKVFRKSADMSYGPAHAPYSSRRPGPSHLFCLPHCHPTFRGPCTQPRRCSKSSQMTISKSSISKAVQFFVLKVRVSRRKEPAELIFLLSETVFIFLGALLSFSSRLFVFCC